MLISPTIDVNLSLRRDSTPTPSISSDVDTDAVVVGSPSAIAEPFFGRTCGEDVETSWAHSNPLGPSVREFGPASRHELLNDNLPTTDFECALAGHSNDPFHGDFDIAINNSSPRREFTPSPSIWTISSDVNTVAAVVGSPSAIAEPVFDLPTTDFECVFAGHSDDPFHGDFDIAINNLSPRRESTPNPSISSNANSDAAVIASPSTIADQFFDLPSSDFECMLASPSSDFFCGNSDAANAVVSNGIDSEAAVASLLFRDPGLQVT
jgi:hypothetical protein